MASKALSTSNVTLKTMVQTLALSSKVMGFRNKSACTHLFPLEHRASEHCPRACPCVKKGPPCLGEVGLGGSECGSRKAVSTQP